MRQLKIFVMLLAAGFLLASPGEAFELLMYRRIGCPWCAAWDREIGPIYTKTDVGRRIPVHFVDLDAPDPPKIRLAGPVRFTPTFVLVEHAREVGRIEGYPGEDFFWGRLEALLPSEPTALGKGQAGSSAGPAH